LVFIQIPFQISPPGGNHSKDCRHNFRSAPQPANPNLSHHTQLLWHVKVRLQTQISLLRRRQVVGIQSRSQIIIIQTCLRVARRRLNHRLQQTQRQISCLRDRSRLRVLRRWKNRALPHRASAATAALGRLRPAHRRARTDDTINRRTQASTAHRRHSGYRNHAANLPQSALFASGCNAPAHAHPPTRFGLIRSDSVGSGRIPPVPWRRLLPSRGSAERR
jgi:hypothetical protein